MSERLTDDELEPLTPIMLELADLLSPPIAERMRFGLEHDAIIREVTIAVPEVGDVDLVLVARFVRDTRAESVTCESNTASNAGSASSPPRPSPAT